MSTPTDLIPSFITVIIPIIICGDVLVIKSILIMTPGFGPSEDVTFSLSGSSNIL